MSALAVALSVVMISCGAVGLWVAARTPRGRVGALAIEGLMISAMVDVCMSETHLVSPVIWGAGLLGVALVVIITARRGDVARRWPAAVHALALILTAFALVMLGGSHMGGGHREGAHHAMSALLAVTLILVAIAHGAVVVAQLRRTDVPALGRSRIVRATASVGASAAMTALAIVGP